MGYRSEVKSLVYGEPEAMAKFKSDNAELIEALALDYDSDLKQFNNGNHEIIFLALDYSKWYDSYSEVIRWNNLLNLANEAELATEFVRIGEDSTGDIETDYTGDYAPYLDTICTISAKFYGGAV
jgi:hypothetical protein